MNNAYTPLVHSLYLAYYGRPADPDGLVFWSEQLARAGGRLDAVIDVFASADEAAVRFGGASVTGRITDVYRQLFDREPDAAGLRFWVDAVESGRTTLAAVTLQVLEGAQGSDGGIVALRLQAAQAFTTAVASSAAGYTGYTGYASIEAGRALIAAVDVDATPDGIAALVRLGLSLSDLAHAAPQVLGTLGVQGQLAPLFFHARGRAEPETLLELVTGLARIAADNPSSLDVLLKGGGMQGLLAAAPRGLSLADLTAALETGGLRALVALVYPRPPEPQPEPQPELPAFAFILEHGVLTLSGASVSPALVDLSQRTVTHDGKVFALPGATPGDAVTQVVVVGYAGTVSLSGTVSELGAALPQSAGVGYRIADVKAALFAGAPGARALTADAARMLAAADLVTVSDTLSLEEATLLDAVPGLDPAKLEIDVDRVAPVPGQLRFDGLPPVGAGVHELVTNLDGFTLRVEGAEAGSTIRYQVADGAGGWTDLPGAVLADLDDGIHVYRAVVIDAAGNLSHTEAFAVTIDTVAPAAGQLRFDGLPPVGDDIRELLTNQDSFTLRVEGAEAGSTIRYQIADGGGDWTDLPGAALADLADGAYAYRAVVTDGAGNVSHTDPFTVTIDTAPPAIRAIGFGANDGALARGERVDLAVVFDAPVTVTAGTVLHLNNGGSAVYQSGSGSGTLLFTYTPATGQSVPLLALAASQALDGSIADRAGNAIASTAFDGLAPGAAPTVDTNPPTAPGLRLASDTGSSMNDWITNVGQVAVSGLETAPGTRWQYQLDGTTWRDGGAIAAGGNASINVSGDGARVVAVRQIDAAGNIGSTASLGFVLDTVAPTLFFDHVEGWTDTRDATALGRADVVFRYDGDLRATDRVWVQIGAGVVSQHGVIDTVARTITLQKQDVAADPTITVQAVDTAGNVSVPVSVRIDGLAGAVALARLATASAVDDTLFFMHGGGSSQLPATGGALVTPVVDPADHVVQLVGTRPDGETAGGDDFLFRIA